MQFYFPTSLFWSVIKSFFYNFDKFRIYKTDKRIFFFSELKTYYNINLLF